MLKRKAALLKIYIGESDKIHGRTLYEEIVFEARKAGMAGATAFKGILSFGASHSIHTQKIFALSEDMPVSVELVDETEKLENFAFKISEMMEHSKRGGLITLQDIDVLRYEVGEKYRK